MSGAAGKRPPPIASLNAVEEMRPARDEIIIATGIKLRDSGAHRQKIGDGLNLRRMIQYVLGRRIFNQQALLLRIVSLMAAAE